MAEARKSSNTTYGLNKDFFICAICTDEWIARDPRDLPCHHTFCRDCLVLLRLKAHKSISLCPTCRAVINWPKNGVLGLAKNLVASNIIQDKNTKETSAKFVEKTTVRKQEKVIPKFCKIHLEEIIFVCKSCSNKEICKDCWKDNHKSHEIDDLETFLDESMRIKFEDSITAVQSTVSEMINHFKSIVPEYNEKYKKLVADKLITENQQIENELQRDLKILKEFEEHIQKDESWISDETRNKAVMKQLDIVEEELTKEIKELINDNITFGDIKNKYSTKNHIEELFKEDLADRLLDPLSNLRQKLIAGETSAVKCKTKSTERIPPSKKPSKGRRSNKKKSP